MKSRRGVSSVVSTVLIVGLVMIMAVTVSVYALNFTEEKREPSPQMHATLEPVSASDGTVLVSTNGGEKLEMENVELVIRNAGNDSQVRIVNLQATGSSFNSSNIVGPESMVQNPGGELDASPSSTDGTLAAGEHMSVELPNLSQGDRVTILIVHVPTNSVIWRESTNATA
ncbi:type IV pilin N-terminal domain-containing protein [Haloarchaeobius sp. HME9146]|uniref:type IV pilin N-terminal domain-containing protein n=1 Tax=Haloarchaeobius sp. HME9146 TaxID=2978732 RepID=UPI0021BF75FA|nr:type IV pilin N-terminal domain-containing protein [Haloarchaeobius sp. HME9146]MCT9096878.1 type IV pilin N-terminal domain-containing protein [Haloarchaeobius sp. HME9146]